jgi:hypothetical protein
MSRWLWWLGPPLIAIALVLVFHPRPLAIEIAFDAQEYCVLINPEHPDTDKITVSYPEPFSFDARL